MIKMAGFIDKTVRESFEMLYQSEFEYYFDSTKFDDYFNYNPVTYKDGIRETIGFIRKEKEKTIL
jgi:hypothetical protein